MARLRRSLERPRPSRKALRLIGAVRKRMEIFLQMRGVDMVSRILGRKPQNCSHLARKFAFAEARGPSLKTLRNDLFFQILKARNGFH